MKDSAKQPKNNHKYKVFISKDALKKTLRLYAFMKPYRSDFFFGLFFLVLTSSATLVIPKMLGMLVDYGTKGRPQSDINTLALVMAAILVLQALFSYMRTFLFVKVTSKTMADLRQYVYSHMIRLPMSFFLKRRVGELNSRISADIAILQDSLTSTVAEFIRTTMLIIGGLIFLIFISPKLTLFMLLILPVVVVISIFFGWFIRQFSKKIQQLVADSNVIVEETLQGIQNVKAYVNELFEISRYTSKTNEAARTGIKEGRYRGSFVAFMNIGMTGSIVAVIWRGTSLISTGGMEAGDLFSFVLYSVFMAGTISGLANAYASLQRTIGSTEQLLEILDEPAEVAVDRNSISKENLISGEIRFENVSFSYPSRPDIEVLKNISFHLEQNRQIALVGPSGSGKSTIVNLLLRLYNSTAGSIRFDNKDSVDIPIYDLRSQIAVVPQDVFLFGGTIRENIAYGKTNATDNEIEDAAMQANAWEFIQELPLKFETIVGERGVQLSGGQRQRIAIARAVLKNPRILILDEATSSLDSSSESLVQEALEKLMTGRTSLIIAHRLSTIRKANRIVVLNQGEIVEEGAHEQLITNVNGLYYKLWSLQSYNLENL